MWILIRSILLALISPFYHLYIRSKINNKEKKVSKEIYITPDGDYFSQLNNKFKPFILPMAGL